MRCSIQRRELHMDEARSFSVLELLQQLNRLLPIQCFSTLSSQSQYSLQAQGTIILTKDNKLTSVLLAHDVKSLLKMKLANMGLGMGELLLYFPAFSSCLTGNMFTSLLNTYLLTIPDLLSLSVKQQMPCYLTYQQHYTSTIKGHKGH